MEKFKTFEDMKNDIPEGATHYQNENKFWSFAWFNSNEDTCFAGGEWVECSMSDYPDGEIKPIPPKRARTEYEKVTFNEDYEHLSRMIRGELFYDCRGEIEYKFNGYGFVCTQGRSEYQDAKWDSKRPSELYRKVEKEIDWQDEVSEYLKNQNLVESGEVLSKKLAFHINDLQWHKATKREFLELCRVALRANGEIE